MGFLVRPHKARLAIFGLLALLFSLPAAAQEGDYPQSREEMSKPVRLYEQKIKAGLVYNFLKYTTWPESSLSDDKKNLRVCLYGGDPFDGYLYPIEGRTAQKHIITIQQVDKISAAQNCHLVFIHRAENASLPQILSALSNRAILTISDITNFTELGGMVEFTTQEDHRIHLYVNKKSIEKAGLTVQERLLKLTELVH
jgi:hypothetical protein